MTVSKPEVWMRGALPDVPKLLQPVAHSLLQSLEEVQQHVPDLTPDQLWRRVNGAASAGYHVRHAAGSLDRLLTYARGDLLSADQLAALKAEGEPDMEPDAAARLVEHFASAVARGLDQVKQMRESSLTEFRGVGRAQLPSTVIGLLVHAAEHTQRHIGQLITTIRITRAL